MFKVKDSDGFKKLSGRSRAKVIDNRDPLKRGYIRVDHPILGGTAWIPYLRLPHIFDTPNVGDLVFIEADCGYYEFPVAWGNLTKGKVDDPSLPQQFKNDVVPQNRGMYTPGGHLFEMHDGKANPTPDPAENELTKQNRGIRWTSIGGHKVAIDDENDSIIVRTSDGSYLIIDQKNKQVNINSVDVLNMTAGGDVKIVNPTSTTIDTPITNITGDASIQGNLQVTGISQLGGAIPLVLSNAQFVHYIAGVPIISTLMTGQTTKVTGI